MKVCFLGLGSIGKRHLKNLTNVCKDRNVNLEVHAFRSSKRELGEEIETLLSKSFYNLSDIDNNYDIVFITNPTSLHFESIKEFANKTNHMFIEKPLFDNLEYDFNELNIKKSGVYYIAAPMRYTNVIKELKNIVEKEKVYSVRNICSSYLPDWRKGVDYRTVYSSKKEQGGGISLDCIHEWDYLVELFGFPDEVFNIQGKYSHLEINSDDLSIYIARYSDKLIELHLDYFGRETRREIELFTEKGTVTGDFIKNEIRFTDERETISLGYDDDEIYIRELNSFLDMIQNNTKNGNDIEHAYDILKLAKGEW